MIGEDAMIRCLVVLLPVLLCACGVPFVPLI